MRWRSFRLLVLGVVSDRMLNVRNRSGGVVASYASWCLSPRKFTKDAIEVTSERERA